MSQYIETEIPKHIKQKESNVSKAKKKSKHKHQYKECLLQYHVKIGLIDKPSTFIPSLVTSLCSYCTICGKIGCRFDENKSIVKNYSRKIGKFYSIISDEELYEQYHDKLPVFFVEDYWKDKYVNLEQNEK